MPAPNVHTCLIRTSRQYRTSPATRDSSHLGNFKQCPGCEQTKTDGLDTRGCPVVAGEVYVKGTAREDCTRGQTVSKLSPRRVRMNTHQFDPYSPGPGPALAPLDASSAARVDHARPCRGEPEQVLTDYKVEVRHGNGEEQSAGCEQTKTDGNPHAQLPRIDGELHATGTRGKWRRTVSTWSLGQM